MNGQFGRKRFAVVLVAALLAVVVGALAYRAGVSHGLELRPPVASAPPAAGAPPVVAGPYGYPYGVYRPWRHGFFGPLFFLFFGFVLLRALFRGLGCGRSYYDGPGCGPSRLDQWHRRAHDRMTQDPAPPTAAS